MVSLIAAMAYFFCLDTKERKNQERGNASAHRPYSRPAPSFGSACAHVVGSEKLFNVPAN